MYYIVTIATVPVNTIGEEYWIIWTITGILFLFFIAILIVCTKIIMKTRKMKSYTVTLPEKNEMKEKKVSLSLSQQINYTLLYTDERKSCYQTNGGLILSIYDSASKDEWKREVNIYNIACLAHDNLLPFVKAEKDFHFSPLPPGYSVTLKGPILGTLKKYLSTLSSPLPDKEALQLCLSLTCGLSHLHHTGKGLVTIAHFNINSHTVLVKERGKCVITDFSTAIKFVDGACDNKNTIKVMTIYTKYYNLIAVVYSSHCMRDLH